MNLIYHPEAEAELINAAKFYEQRVSGLGAEYLDVIDKAIRKIQTDPERWNIKQSQVRNYILDRFPYSIYYRVFSDHIRILAIKHHSRHPDYWRYRLEN